MTPSLARGARLRWDAARGQHVLLYPEGVLLLNPEAAAVLELIDGARTINDVIDALALAHDGTDRDVIDRDVRELLERLRGRGFVTWEPP